MGLVFRNLAQEQIKEKGTIRALIRTAEFRQLKSKRMMMNYIHTRIRDISPETIAKLFNVSVSTAWRSMVGQTGGIENNEHIINSEQRNKAILTLDEEQTLLDWIAARQEAGDCPISIKVRHQAQEMYLKTHGHERQFNRQWWYNFKNHHEETIATGYVNAVEEARHDLSVITIQRYLSNLLQSVMGLASGRLLVNMDDRIRCKTP